MKKLKPNPSRHRAGRALTIIHRKTFDEEPLDALLAISKASMNLLAAWCFGKHVKKEKAENQP
jgi:hypothetical protein